MTQPVYNANRLFIASCLALLVTSLTFALRASIGGVFTGEYAVSSEDVGWAFGSAFWGFTIATYIGGLIIDTVKIKTFIWIAFFMHLIGLVLLIMSKDATMLFVSNIFIGLGNGSVEAACNPLVTTIYPNDKTKMLNRFHVWFPGGAVVGGILAIIIMNSLHLSWHVLTGLLFIPLAIYGYLFFGQTIPETERVQSGVTYREMLRNIGAPFTIIIVVLLMILAACFPQIIVLDFSSSIPYIILAVIVVAVIVEGAVINKSSLIFPLMLLAMLLSASTELGTNQWTGALLEKTEINGIVILVVVTGIMAVGRFFAGPVIHRLNPAGVLLGSAVLSVVGLYMFSISEGAAFTMTSAIVFAAGVCYFWPTMLGFVSEYIPKSGALGLSIMGGAGMVATSMVLPIMGRSIDTLGPQETLSYMAILPGILIVIFLFINFVMKPKKS